MSRVDATVGHITMTGKPGGRVDAECGVCGQGIDVPPTFGPIPQDIMLAEWVKQHLHRGKGGTI